MLCRTLGNCCRFYGKYGNMETSALVNFTKDLPQNTTVIQSEYTEQYSKSSNDSAISRQSMTSGQQWTTISGATCICDAVFNPKYKGRPDFLFSSRPLLEICYAWICLQPKILLKYKHSKSKYVSNGLHFSSEILDNIKINCYAKKSLCFSVDVVLTIEFWWEHLKNNFRIYQLP